MDDEVTRFVGGGHLGHWALTGPFLVMEVGRDEVRLGLTRGGEALLRFTRWRGWSVTVGRDDVRSVRIVGGGFGGLRFDTVSGIGDGVLIWPGVGDGPMDRALGVLADGGWPVEGREPSSPDGASPMVSRRVRGGPWAMSTAVRRR